MTSTARHGLGGHADRPVVMRERHGGQVIVKTYLAADGGRVFSEQQRLWESPLGARRRTPGIPEPLSWDGRSRELTMEAVGGIPLATRESLGDAASQGTPAAALLADLHTCGVVVQRRRPAARIVASLVRKADDVHDDPIGPDYRAVVERLASLAEARAIDTAETLVPSHGDWSPRNVLRGPTGVRMIDLDRVQMAGAGRDVAYWGAWAWVTQLLGGEQPNWDLGDAYENAYLTCRPSSRDDLALTAGFHRAAGLLRIAHAWSALSARPAQRRRVVAEAGRL